MQLRKCNNELIHFHPISIFPSTNPLLHGSIVQALQSPAGRQSETGQKPLFSVE